MVSDPVILIIELSLKKTSPFFESQLNLTRLHFFCKPAFEVGTVAMAGLLSQDLLGQANLSGGLHHKASAKRIIY